MKKLEPRDIAGYLPYGLCIQNYELGNEDAPPSEALAVYGAPDLHHLDVYGMEDQPHLDDVRPVLRSLSDLTREITHKGEKFVPIVELAMIETDIVVRDNFEVIRTACKNHEGWNVGVMYRDNETPECYCGGEYKILTFGHESASFLGQWGDGKGRHVFNQVRLFDKLNEWMFDYRDLIGQGLAIDVNTLKENCYE